MATILEAVGDYLVAQGQGTLGTNLFLSLLPDSPDVCVSLYESSGGEPRYVMSVSGQVVDQPNLQVICRATRDDYPTARDKAETIRQLLEDVVGLSQSGVQILSIVPTGSVNPLGVDPEHRPLVSVNFRCMVLR